MNPKYIITILMLLICSGTASAWLSGYDHRINITVNNGGGSTLTDYQFNFTNDTNVLVAMGHMQASGADCRITDASDNLIPFWNETAFNASATKIWVNATLTTGDNTFYMYYGNVMVSSVADISDTFLFGDEFMGFPTNDSTFNIDSSLDIGGFSCWAHTRIHPINDTTVWIYVTQYESSTESHIVRRVYDIPSNTNTSETSLWDDSGVICSTRGFGKVGDTYHILYYHQTAAGGDISLRKRESTDGINFNASTDGLLFNATSEFGGDCVKISDNEFWFYTYNSSGMMRFVINESGYSDPIAVTGLSAAGMARKYDDIYYLYANSGGRYYSYASTDGTAFGTGADLIAGVINSNQMEKIGNKYYLFYMQDQTSLRVARCDTPNGTFTYMQQLYSGYRCPSDTMVFDTNKVLMTNALMPENAVERFYVDQLSMTDLTVNTNIWNPSGTPTIASGEIVLNGNDGIISIDTFGFETIVTTRSKADEQDIDFIGYNVSNDNHSELTNTDYLMNDDFDNILFTTKMNGAVVSPGLYNDGWSDFRNTFYPYTIKRINTTYLEYGQGSNSNTTTAAYIITGDAAIFMRVWNSSQESNLTSDWVFVRQYTATEPTSQLGTEEDAPAGGNDITIPANAYGFLCEDPSIAHPFDMIAPEFAHEVCFSWLNNSGECWEFYWSGDAYNSDLSIPANDAYFVLMDGTGETVSCGVAQTEDVNIPVGWSATYLRNEQSWTLSDIKPDMGTNVIDLYTWDHNAGGTGAWTNSSSFFVLPNQGLLVNSIAPFIWDGNVSGEL